MGKSGKTMDFPLENTEADKWREEGENYFMVANQENYSFPSIERK
jgi:hypothetical protein